MKPLLIILFTAALLSAQSILPASLDVMKELQITYRTGEIQSYIDQVLANQGLSEEDSVSAAEEITQFFESDNFVETGAQYLTSLFTEREISDMLMVLRDSSLKNDPNYSGAAKLEQMMNKLRPLIVKYLRHKTTR